MKRKIDYIIYNSEGSRLLFRFYPRRSHVHGFTDKTPTTWDAVYKTYFSWAIISQDRWDEHSEWESEIMYAEDFDECSALDKLAYVLGLIVSGKNEEQKYTLRPFGDGTTWKLERYLPVSYFGEEVIPTWEFELWQSYTHKGYYFTLTEDQLQSFKDTIDYILEYMLQHSEGI